MERPLLGIAAPHCSLVECDFGLAFVDATSVSAKVLHSACGTLVPSAEGENEAAAEEGSGRSGSPRLFAQTNRKAGERARHARLSAQLPSARLLACMHACMHENKLLFPSHVFLFFLFFRTCWLLFMLFECQSFSCNQDASLPCLRRR